MRVMAMTIVMTMVMVMGLVMVRAPTRTMAMVLALAIAAGTMDMIEVKKVRGKVRRARVRSETVRGDIGFVSLPFFFLPE